MNALLGEVVPVLPEFVNLDGHEASGVGGPSDLHVGAEGDPIAAPLHEGDPQRRVDDPDDPVVQVDLAKPCIAGEGDLGVPIGEGDLAGGVEDISHGSILRWHYCH